MTIDPGELYGISFYEYGEAYYGSGEGTRFRVAREPLENVHYTPPDKRGEAVLKASVWPEPYSYASTDSALIEDRTFPFSQEGLEAVLNWLNQKIG